MDVSIIIVTYNTLSMTRDCIDSVIKHTAGISYEIILVDNASKDGSRKYFDKLSNIKYIYSEENLGFGRANNLGLIYATGDYIFFLNSDTLTKNNASKYFYDYCKTYNKPCVLGTMLYSAEGKETLSFENLPTISSILFDSLTAYMPFLLNNKRNEGKDNVYPKNVGYISGAALFVPKNLIKEIGAFDPKFFMYYEETDWQMRMSKVGIERIVIDSPKIIHFGGMSFGQSKAVSMRREEMVLRSLFIYLKNNFPSLHYYLFRCIYPFLKLPPMLAQKCTMGEKVSYFRTMLS